MIEILADFRLGASDNGPMRLDAGWAPPETSFTWSIGHDSSLSIPLRPGAGELTVEMTISTFVLPPRLCEQRVVIWLNDEAAGARVIGGETTMVLHAGGDTTAGRDVLRIRLHCPDAARPSDLGLNTDARLLGVCLHRVVVLRSPTEALPVVRRGAHVLELNLAMGWGGNVRQFLLEGWGAPENGHSWAVGRRSTLRLPIAEPGASYAVLLEVQPLISRQHPVPQRLIAGANDLMIGMLVVDVRRTVALTLPAAATARDKTEVTLSFDNLDAASPRDHDLYADGRPLAFMLLTLRLVRLAPAGPYHQQRLGRLAGRAADGSVQAEVARVCGMEITDLLAKFESLGHSCALSRLQRRHGVEPPGLLRFGGLSTGRLIDGLISRFVGLGRPDSLSFFEKPPFGTFWLYESAYGVACRTPYHCDAGAPPASAFALIERRLGFLRRKFLEDVDGGEKLFVFYRPEPATREEADAVVAALGLTAPNTVLWLVDDGTVPAGAVARLTPHLLQGGIDYRSVDEDDPNLMATEETWLSVLANAWQLVQSSAAGRDTPGP